ncbi:MAG: XRE family transcriptional regulator [Deltaproteobacteria bacterium]|nr:MAG: XRE family transcriptional regulator [Deltaproteobacteria bacterium]
MSKGTKKELWVCIDLRSRRLFELSLNVLAKARELAGSVSGVTVAVLLDAPGPQPLQDGRSGHQPIISANDAAEECTNYGADRACILANKLLGSPRPDLYASALAGFVARHNPMLVMFPLTDFGRETAARTARIVDAGLISECVDVLLEKGKVVANCPAWGGDFMCRITFLDPSRTGFLTIQPHAVRATEVKGRPGLVDRVDVEIPDIHKGIKLLSNSPRPKEAQRLEDAHTIVVGGAGLGNIDNFSLVRELSVAMGAELAATRPPVLEHWVDEERLIGQTGKSVRPKLLLSIGTSGAVQYVAGIMEAQTIVAVNRDKNAPIFQIADIGIIADAKTILPRLIDRVSQVTMRKLADDLGTREKSDSRNAFGERVKKLREAHNWTIEALSKATGQSPEFIEKVEKGITTPPVAFLLRFARALKIDPDTFLRREEKALIRSLKDQAFMKRTQDYAYQTLSPGEESHHLRAFMVTIEAKKAHKPLAYKHEGEEFIFVLEGELKLTLGDKDHRLRSGESIHFNSDTPHKLKSISSEATRCLVVLFTP